MIRNQNREEKNQKHLQMHPDVSIVSKPYNHKHDHYQQLLYSQSVSHMTTGTPAWRNPYTQYTVLAHNASLQFQNS